MVQELLRQLREPSNPSAEAYDVYEAGAQLLPFKSAWAPKACKIMAFMAIIMGLGPLFYILLGFR